MKKKISTQPMDKPKVAPVKVKSTFNEKTKKFDSKEGSKDKDKKDKR